METNELYAVSPIDGRYASKTKDLRNYFSEFALIKSRLQVEVEYFIALCEMPLPQLIKFPTAEFKTMRNWIKNFSDTDAKAIKEFERVTNHDVKAVEYFLREKFDGAGLSPFKEFIHFGLTSQDINNTAFPLLFKGYIEKSFIPFMEEELLIELNTIAQEWKNIPMLARTHGQPASPTTMGRELMVFIERITHQLKSLKQIPFTCKFGGATGGLNAHYATYSAINWHNFASDFTLKKLSLERQRITTQIEHYDYLASFFDNLKRINNILIDMSRDIWTYISLGYFDQRSKKNEVGSSAMPHKVNPIDFENAEGNLGMANAVYEHLSSKLPISRLQRDLTDSTVLRNIGVPIAHSVIAYKSLMTGLGKLMLNRQKMEQDLQDNFVVVAEAIQSILRREAYPDPYDALKQLTRNNKTITRESMHEFIDGLSVGEDIKSELKSLSPFTYVGVSNTLTQLK